MQFPQGLVHVPRLNVNIRAIQHPSNIGIDGGRLGKALLWMDAFDDGVGRTSRLEEVDKGFGCTILASLIQHLKENESLGREGTRD